MKIIENAGLNVTLEIEDSEDEKFIEIRVKHKDYPKMDEEILLFKSEYLALIEMLKKYNKLMEFGYKEKGYQDILENPRNVRKRQEERSSEKS